MTVRSAALVLVGLMMAGAAEPQTTPPGLRCWGVPADARRLGRADDRRFEVRDELPGPPSLQRGGPDRTGNETHTRLIAPDRPFSGTMWVPLTEPAEADAYILRNIPYHRVVTTPGGSFDLTVAQLRAVRVGTREDGLLVCLDFDPGGRGAARYPLPEVFEQAREHELLSGYQQQRLTELDRVVAARWPRLQQAWDELTESPYLVASRRKLFDLLRDFHNPQPAVAAEELAPERFFNRDQRIRLRSEGQEIRGRCSLWAGADRATIELDACPLVQLARAWNHLARSHGGPFLKAVGEGTIEEIDSFKLEAVGLTEPAARHLVFSTLAGLPGLATATTPPATP